MGEYLLLRVGDEHFPQNNFGLILEPKYPIYLKLGYFWSPSRGFWHWKTQFLDILLLYDIVKTKWKVCWNGQLTQKVGLWGASSNIIVMIVETVRYARVARNILEIVAL